MKPMGTLSGVGLGGAIPGLTQLIEALNLMHP